MDCKTTYRVFNIKWDTDGETVELPEQLEIDIYLATDTDDELIEDIISEEITEVTGWCHDGFLYEIQR